MWVITVAIHGTNNSKFVNGSSLSRTLSYWLNDKYLIRSRSSCAYIAGMCHLKKCNTLLKSLLKGKEGMMIYSTLHVIIYKLYNITFVSNRTLSHISFVVNGNYAGHFTEPKEHTIKDVKILALSNKIQLCSFLRNPPHSIQQHTISTHTKMFVLGCLSNCVCHVAINDDIKIIIITIHIYIVI